MPRKFVQPVYPETLYEARKRYNTTIGTHISYCNESYVIDVLKNNSDLINFFKARNIVFTSFSPPTGRNKCDIIGDCLDQEIGLQVKHLEPNYNPYSSHHVDRQPFLHLQDLLTRHFSKNLKRDLEFFLKSCYDVWSDKERKFTEPFSKNQLDSILQFLNNLQVKRKLLSTVFNTGTTYTSTFAPDYFVISTLDYELTKDQFIKEVNCEKFCVWHNSIILDYLETLE